uniref:GNAT family N-acetyltransferase n=1 Tax=Cupriavidus yeoncheonensis TaxID=1462994 RepID=UPI003F498261
MQLRDMVAADLTAALSLSEHMRWPYRASDWETLFALGEGRIAQRGDTVAGMGLRWLWEPRGASVGLVIVAPASRGQGSGRRLMEALTAGVGNGPVLLHAPAESEPFCRRLGFTPRGDVHRYEGKAIQAPLMALPQGCRLRPAGRKDLPRLVAMDHAASGTGRRRLIEAWLAHAIGAVVLDHADGPLGFAILRRFGRGAMIGPVVAPGAGPAKAMIAHLAGLAGGRFLRIDAMADPAIEAWLRDLGLLYVGGVRALTKGAFAPASPDFTTFALADLATG